MKELLAAGCTLLLAFLQPLAAQDQANGLKVEPDENQVLASSLVGTWQLDVALNQRLGHDGGEPTLQFVADPTVLKKVPAAIARKLAEHRIYLAGSMQVGDKQHAFLVVQVGGNSMITWFRERDGDAMADAESWIAFIARGKARPLDLLFVGGDHNNQSFAAYSRMPTQPAAFTPVAVIADMTRLLVAGEAKAFITTYCAPADLEEMANKGRGVDVLAQRFEGERGTRFLQALEIVSKTVPTMSEDGNRATWSLDVDGLPASLSLQRIDGRWYLRNR